jgi:sugar phosphate isomerase/epimerase
MKRREFLSVLGALAGVAGCRTLVDGTAKEGRMLFGSTTSGSLKDVRMMAEVGFDFYETSVAAAFNPLKDDAWWRTRRAELAEMPLPLLSCNGFLPGSFRLTGPWADFEPALAYAETALRRAEEAGVSFVVFGSGAARNVPGDMLGARDQLPDPEKGVEQFTAFCRLLCRRVADLKKVTVVIEPLRPKESNIVNYVWQGRQICEDVGSERLRLLADIFHMMMGRESAQSILAAGPLLRHCHIASYGTRLFPGSDPAQVARFKPYFEALRAIGYTGGVSCECGWGNAPDRRKNFETALRTLRSL